MAEGLIDALLLFIVVLTSILDKLCLIIRWNPVSKVSTRSVIPAMEHFTRSRVVSVDCWFFINSSMIAFNMERSSLELTHSSSSSPASDGRGGGCPYFGGMVNRKQRVTQAGYRLVKKLQEPKVETHTLSSILPCSYECSTYTIGGNQCRYEN
jgi:hypothetical protein